MFEHEKKGLFLLTLRDGVRENKEDRLLSCSTAETTWKEVEAWIKSDPKFKEEYEEIRKESRVSMEDILREKARGGDQQAIKMLLAAEEPEKYGNKIKVQVDAKLQINSSDVQAFGEHWLLQMFRKELVTEEIRYLEENVNS